jgi:hypothetical protein
MSYWNSEDENGFIWSMQNKIGQISLNTKFGKLIYEYAKNNEYKNILEIGTWNGLGSTKCFIEGLLSRQDDFNFYSLECNEDKCSMAKKLYQQIENVHILNEVILNELPSNIYKIFPEILTNSDYNYWNKIDFANMKDKHLFLEREKLPEYFDILLLDGGEFTTYYEFQILKNKCKILMLDDTNVQKCKLIVEEIKNNLDKWEIIEENNERNGFLICKNKLI